MTTWKQLISDAAGSDKIVYCTLSDEELNEEFDNEYGEVEGKPFTAWSETRVYFPVVYDGSEWVESAPRNPCDEATIHAGHAGGG